jgi:FkbM family methyltransferase
LNIALSDQTGHLIFSDPGEEGGRLVGGNFSDLPSISKTDLDKLGTCQLGDAFKTLAIDHNRRSIVPTYTVDLLISSLDQLGTTNENDEILMLKIDTEGHDFNVIKGAKDLLRRKRVTFILFEVWNNQVIADVATFLDAYDYQCFLLTPRTLVPVHPKDFWCEYIQPGLVGY